MASARRGGRSEAPGPQAPDPRARRDRVRRLFPCPPSARRACGARGRDEAQLRVEKALRMISPRRGIRVLLLGEAEGMLARRLSRCAGVEVTWLEPGGGAEGAASPLASTGYTRLAGDLCGLPFPAGTFDAAAAQFTLDFLSDGGRALSEWARVLKEGGRLVLVARNRLYRGPEPRPGPRPLRAFAPAELREAVEAAGFVVNDISTLIPDLRLPALYRGDLSFCLFLEKVPGLRMRGRLLFIQAEKRGAGRCGA